MEEKEDIIFSFYSKLLGEDEERQVPWGTGHASAWPDWFGIWMRLSQKRKCGRPYAPYPPTRPLDWMDSPAISTRHGGPLSNLILWQPFLLFGAGSSGILVCSIQPILPLISKKDDTSSIKDYRPISLVHSFAKLVTKILANRLAGHLNQMVSSSQSAFIKGRFIQDNFMLVQQMARYLHQQKQPRNSNPTETWHN